MGQVSINSPGIENRKTHVRAALPIPIINNERFEVTEEMVIDIVDQANKFGRVILNNIGDAAFRAIHS